MSVYDTLHGEGEITFNFTVPSCDEAIAKVRELGGDVLAGPFSIGAGRISVVRDPQCAAFALFEGETDD